jgi:hypothetical protein
MGLFHATCILCYNFIDEVDNVQVLGRHNDGWVGI